MESGSYPLPHSKALRAGILTRYCRGFDIVWLSAIF